MKILSRYILRMHATPFIFAFTALTGFLLVQQVSRRIETLLGKGLPTSVIFEFFALTLPYLVAMTLSMAVLVSVLYAFGRMAEDKEITAIRAGGVSLWQILLPVLIGATAVGAVAFVFGDQILPRTNHRLRVLMTDIARTRPTFSLKEHAINQVGLRRRYYLRAAQINQSTYWMKDVALYDLAEARSARVIYADSGFLGFTPNQEDLQLWLYASTIHEFDREDPRMFQTSDADQQVLIIRGIGSDFVRREDDNYRGDREMGTCQLDSVVHVASSDEFVARRLQQAARQNSLRSLVGLPTVAPDTTVAPHRPSLYCRGAGALAAFLLPASLSAQTPLQDSALRRLNQHLNQPARQVLETGAIPTNLFNEWRVQNDRAGASKLRAANYAVELHKKYAIPAACVVFVLIGAPIALRFAGGGVGLVVAGSILVFGIYYIGLIAGESLANRLVVPPFWAMWSSNILFASLGIFLLWRTHRAGTARRAR